MATSVRTKAPKKQPAFAQPSEDIRHTRQLEQAVLELENSVVHILMAEQDHTFQDVDFLFWHRQLTNVAMQVSLALSEFLGTQRFHYHYRHEPSNHNVLYPVAGPDALTMLVRVSREALTQCAEMVGMQQEQAMFARSRLEQSLRSFLQAAAEK